MSGANPGRSEALALCRQLPPGLDPLDLYAALSDGGRRTDTMLLERSVGPGLLLDQAAVRIECRGSSVSLTALSAGGRNVLEAVEAAMAERVTGRSDDALTLTFPRSRSDDPAGTAARALPVQPAALPVVRPRFGLAGGALHPRLRRHRRLRPCRPDRGSARGGRGSARLSRFPVLAGRDPGRVRARRGAARGLHRLRLGRSGEERARLFRRGAAAGRAGRPLRQGEAGGGGAAPGAACPTSRPTSTTRPMARSSSRMKEHIAAGEVYQIVPSRTFRAPCADPMAAFAAQRRLDPSPYHFFVSAPDHVLIGASPETSVRLFREDGIAKVEVKPIAGTRPRGATGDEDDRLEAEMRLDDKELAEHMMLVDLARNDVARVSASGTRRVAEAADRRALRPGDAHGLVGHRHTAARHGRGRRAPGLPQCRHPVRRAQDPRDRAAARDRGDQARPLWRRDRLAQRRRDDGHAPSSSARRWCRTAPPSSAPAPASSTTAIRRRKPTRPGARPRPCSRCWRRRERRHDVAPSCSSTISIPSPSTWWRRSSGSAATSRCCATGSRRAPRSRSPASRRI